MLEAGIFGGLGDGLANANGGRGSSGNEAPDVAVALAGAPPVCIPPALEGPGAGRDEPGASTDGGGASSDARRRRSRSSAAMRGIGAGGTGTDDAAPLGVLPGVTCRAGRLDFVDRENHWRNPAPSKSSSGSAIRSDAMEVDEGPFAGGADDGNGIGFGRGGCGEGKGRVEGGSGLRSEWSGASTSGVAA